MQPDSSYHKWESLEEVKLAVQGVSSAPRKADKAHYLPTSIHGKATVILYILLALCFVVFTALLTVNFRKLSQDVTKAQLDQDKIRRDSKRNLSALQDSLELEMSKEFRAFNNQLVKVSQAVDEAQQDREKIRRDSKTSVSALQDSIELKMSTEINTFNSQLLNVSKELAGLRLAIQAIQADHRNVASQLPDFTEIRNLTHTVWRELAAMRQTHYGLQEALSKVQEEIRNITEIICTKCPPGWQQFEKNCYYFSTSTTTWSDAKQFCTRESSQLVIIKTKQEHTFLSNHVIKHREYWLGLSDSAQEGEWKWLDGSHLSFKFWAPGEPNNAGHGEDCGTLRADGTWNDVPCSVSEFWICKRPC